MTWLGLDRRSDEEAANRRRLAVLVFDATLSPRIEFVRGRYWNHGGYSQIALNWYGFSRRVMSASVSDTCTASAASSI
jgi:hypothetical protein